MAIDKNNSCFNCVNSFACALLLDDGHELTEEKINETCKRMGGFKRRS